MKKVLLGTTALFGAGLIASPAFAADGIKLAVGGFFREAYLVNFDDDSEGEVGNERNTDGFFNDAEIHFKGETTLDNGLTVGARVELEGETESDQIDEAWVSFSGGFGEIHVGSEDDALANNCIVPPGGSTNFSAFSPNQWGANTLTSLTGSTNLLSSNSVCSGVDESSGGDAQKILYVTPSFAGFQLALSYTPNGGDQSHFPQRAGPHVGMPINVDDESRHNVSVYATYAYEGDGWGLTWGGGGSWEGHVEKTGPGADREESDFYQTGLNLSFGNFSVGGVFEYYNDIFSFDGDGGANAKDGDAWVAGGGVSYSMDPYTIGFQYSHRDEDQDNESGEDSSANVDRFILTGNYALGPGINVDAELAYTTQDVDGPDYVDSDDNYDAFEIGIGTAITF